MTSIRKRYRAKRNGRRLCFRYFTNTTDCETCGNNRTTEIIKYWREGSGNNKEQQPAVIGFNKCIGTFQGIKAGAMWGCVLSRDLLLLYSAQIMRPIEGRPGVAVCGHDITDLWYSEDTLFIETSDNELQKMIDSVVVKSKKIIGPSLNNRKRTVIVLFKKRFSHKCALGVNGNNLGKHRNQGSWHMHTVNLKV